jgi:hypothetical protein
MNKSYKELLEDVRWKKKSAAIRKRDRYTCRGCGVKDTTLHVHHTRYYKDMPPWAVENEYLITLCKSCHEKEHKDKHISEFQYIGKNQIKKNKKLLKQKINKERRKNRNVVFSKPFVPKTIIEKPKLTQSEIKQKILENKEYKENLKNQKEDLPPRRKTKDEITKNMRRLVKQLKSIK